ncbi:hypothetical protein XELAEV_18004687mg [Xenopus laevis]|uniref:Uncharacterized protein n=1 Tax=Xenopus laevis TaxID=8355 RepID=A0A974BQX5_XENLA|nr:hypothetical protein XELAEV_18004687mg [Xenopus laevis]
MGSDTNANTKSILKHDQAILDLRRHTEDLENRSRRGNIRICGFTKARDADGIHFEENTIHLYQDLAASTITQRRLLKPITSSLRERGISYKWGFPFALLAHKGGKIFALRYPVDAPLFCQQLDIPIADVLKWRNYILGPPDDDPLAIATDGLSTPSRLR